jgi:hypothetical protein
MSKLREMLESRFMRKTGDAYYLQLPHKFNLGSNANMALGLALENGSNMRHFVQRPIPRDYFQGPLLEDVSPPTTVVYQAYREGTDLILEVESSKPHDLILKNVTAIKKLEGLDRKSWNLEDKVLHIATPGRHLLRIVVGA